MYQQQQAAQQAAGEGEAPALGPESHQDIQAMLASGGQVREDFEFLVLRFWDD